MTDGSASYDLVDRAGAWASIRRDLTPHKRGMITRLAERLGATEDQSPEDVYWTLRAFGLEGRVAFDFGPSQLVWGGFLLDLASAVAEWLTERPATHTFHPAEQSNNVATTLTGTTAIVRSGHTVAAAPSTAVVAAYEMFLRLLADDAGREAPQLQLVPGMEWLSHYQGRSRDARA